MVLNKVEICGVNTAKLPLLSDGEKEVLFEKIKAGDEEAKEQYIKGNLRLVLSVIKRFSGSSENPDDLFQIGCIGLIKAINNFNPELEVKFSTYAVPMIIGEIRRFIRDNNSIRVSRSLRDTAYKAIYAKENYVKVNQKEPTVQEIAEEIGIAKEEIVYALDAIQMPVSLNEPVYNDNGDAMYVMDQISDKKNKEETWVEHLSLSEAMKRLKGEKGSKVKLGVYRPGEKDLLHFTVIRGNIPVKSIDAAYMINEKVGYIKVNKFGETTYPELLIALAKLNQKNCEGLIVDLRGNTGGYMAAAIQMVNEFLPNNRLIVYTQGRKSPREDYNSNGTGSNQKMPLVVLVDEGSASASEIFAGAIQDNDRGTIVGRRSFGKGLVQQPIEFSDGSAIRLTIARYYTPSGRCIQKPYEKGKESEYELDLLTRYEHGEFFSADSIKQDETEVYHTRLGRPVYGGGGIMPDIFVPQDTTGMTSYFRMAANRGLIIRYTFDYTDQNRSTLQKYDTPEKMEAYLKGQNLLNKFAAWAEKKGLKRRNNLMMKSRRLFEMSLYGNIIYNMLGMEAYVEYLNESDKTVLKAVEILEKGESFPQAPSPQAATDKKE